MIALGTPVLGTVAAEPLPSEVPSQESWPAGIPVPFHWWGVTPEGLAAIGDALVPAGILVGCLLVVWLAVGAYLARRRPVAFWYGYGFWFLRLRMRRSWSRLTTTANLTANQRPNTGVSGSKAGRGRAVVPAVPPLIKIRPQRYGATAVIALHPGQVPQRIIEASDAMAHAWGVHAVRAVARRRGRVELTILRGDPLTDRSVSDPEVTAPAVTGQSLSKVSTAPKAAVPEDLCAVVGNREDGRSWVLDLVALPHWLITGATQSGKSMLINAAVARWASRPVALVGIDCKGGMELAPLEARLSALACDRNEAAHVLGELVTEAQRRMALCRAHRARNIWQLPAEVRPVPVIVIVDELAELYLVADKAEKDAALRATTNLLRLAQLGAALAIHLIVAGQRVGSDFGPGVTALRAQLGGRICLRVHDSDTAKMTLGDINPDAVEAAQRISDHDKGVAITTAEAGWIRARSSKFTDEALDRVVDTTYPLAPELPGIKPTPTD